VGLREYQIAAIRDVFAAMREVDRVCLVLPTGTGKTRTAADVVRRGVERSRRCLWLAHRTELIDQSAATLAGLGIDVGVISAASSMRLKNDALTQVASIQTLLARDHRPPADLIIWDECHHGPAEEWSGLLDAYPAAKVLGLTATPERGDGKGLGPVFQAIVAGISVRQATMQGYLVPCEIIRPGRRLETGELAQDPLDAYREHGVGRQGFLFARTVAEAHEYAARFSAAGVATSCIHAGTPEDERAHALREFRSGLVRLLSNVYVMTEGVDLPAASVCILARSIGSVGGYLQMVGRILRPALGKTSATLIDLPGISHDHGCPEDERVFALEGKAIRLAVRACKVCSAPLTEYPCSRCGYSPEVVEGGELVEASITGDPLVKFARKIAESPEQRWETCKRWIADLETRGKNTASIFYKWEWVYREKLDPTWYRAAVTGKEISI
jgi:superfamily II DNA or RNA helicase